jgi:hypothetical protein
MNFIYNDGGRARSGYSGVTGDCVTRSIAIVTGKPYIEVYNALNELSVNERRGKNKRGISNARTGVYRTTYERYILSLGYKWKPTMLIGQGCKVHMRENELPKGRLIISVSRHMTAVIDGVIHDTHDCSRSGNRCVYGYFFKPLDI